MSQGDLTPERRETRVHPILGKRGGAAKRMVAGVAALLALVAACDDSGREGATSPPSGGRPELKAAGPAGGWVEVQLPAKKDQSWVHGSYVVCLSKPGDVEITSVEFRSGNVKVTGWAARPNPARQGEDLAGDWPGETLQTRGIENQTVLHRVCEPDQGNSYELVLQLQSSKSSTEGDGILVHYVSDGRDGTLELADRVVLCVRPERPDCA